jgi:glycosyltransferase involved in cell wall biosynthesis
VTLPIDSVYFLMFPGWRTEAQANRWHYSRRWARHVPVVLVQPELPAGTTSRCEPEPRIQNVEILSVQERNSFCRPSFFDGLIQAKQICDHARNRRHVRPLLWFYNPYLVFACALVPAVGRIYHATENYFDFVNDADFLNMLRASIALSDKVVCCSAGVLEGIRAKTGRDDLELVPNGCDYRVYANPQAAQGGWLDILRPAIDAGKPIAIFAGGINLRLDFGLMHRLAEEIPELHFAYAGYVDLPNLTPKDQRSWHALLRRPNVSYLGRLDPGDLPSLYRLSDRGFIPYRHLPFIVKNGFPLKALEMAASGLPVVASLMEPLLAVPDAVETARTQEEFIARLAQASRKTRSATLVARADAVCRQYDYDQLFERVTAVAQEIAKSGAPQPAPLSPVYKHIGFDRSLWDLDQLPSPVTGQARGVAAGVLSRLRKPAPPELSRRERLLWHVPPQLAAWVPKSIKLAAKRLLFAGSRGLLQRRDQAH